MNDKRERVIEKMLEVTKDILYAKDEISRRDKVDSIINVLGEEYDF